ncbi:MAG: response regulator, partial [Nitrospira sp.]|nr:response regulator [Nitrospira sp.]
TTFIIYLPVIKQPHLNTIGNEVSVDGTENILLIDDDVDVLTVTKEILREHGYHVTAVYDSSKAVAIFKEHSEKIQLVITDLVMPLVDGDEFIKISKGIKPEIKIIVISAYPQNLVSSASIDAVIQKPFENAHLVSTVRQVLDHGQEEQLFLDYRQDPRVN